MRRIIQLWIVISLTALLSSCSSTAHITKTRLNIQFPFEPSFPGYIVDIASKDYTADLACSLAPDGSPGKILDLDAKDGAEALGTCDTKSMTLDTGIKDEITVTVI